MKLIQITYSTASTYSNDWNLEQLDLNRINLIVGKNATGKSRVAQLISSTAKMISQQVPHLFFGLWKLVFSSDLGEIIYQFKIDGTVKKEQIHLNNKIVLERIEDNTSIFSYKSNTFSNITPPKNKLVLQVRRDKEEYPYLEPIVSWAERTYGFKFGNINPYSFLIDKDIDRLTSIDEIPSLLQTLEEQGKGIEIKNIIKEFNSLGYEIYELGVSKGRIREVGNILYVLEKNIKRRIPQNQLSQGMFRALSLLIFLEYLNQTKEVATIIIDDLCEGLDYDRALKLGKLLINKLNQLNIQFIATSNDSFLMDVFPIKYWNVLTRDSNVIKTINYQNSKDLFENFKYTGLSNFDFFSSDYIIKGK